MPRGAREANKNWGKLVETNELGYMNFVEILASAQRIFKGWSGMEFGTKLFCISFHLFNIKIYEILFTGFRRYPTWLSVHIVYSQAFVGQMQRWAPAIHQTRRYRYTRE